MVHSYRRTIYARLGSLRYQLLFTAILALIAYYVYCSEVAPFSGRRRSVLVPYAVERAVGLILHSSLRMWSPNDIAPDAAATVWLMRVTERLLIAASQFEGVDEMLSTGSWVLRLEDAPDVLNCLYSIGGRIIVPSGLLKSLIVTANPVAAIYAERLNREKATAAALAAGKPPPEFVPEDGFIADLTTSELAELAAVDCRRQNFAKGLTRLACARADPCDDPPVYPVVPVAPLPRFKRECRSGALDIQKTLAETLEYHPMVVAVLAHEVGHGLHRHPAEKLTLSQLKGAVGHFVGHDFWTDALSEYGLLLPKSRQQELEADTAAVHLLNALGKDPRAVALVAFQLAQHAHEGNSESSADWFATHPGGVTRIRNALSVARDLMNPSGAHSVRNAQFPRSA